MTTTHAPDYIVIDGPWPLDRNYTPSTLFCVVVACFGCAGGDTEHPKHHAKFGMRTGEMHADDLVVNTDTPDQTIFARFATSDELADYHRRRREATPC
jgi:hypothetical protein|tara:strand:- start:60 stop:353 length:294 start_codon:yes stop_codon:yes gene_type:complete